MSALKIGRIAAIAAAGAVAGLLVAGQALAGNIDNTGGGLSADIHPFGAGGSTATYGQTFTAGGSTMQSFSLFLDQRYLGPGYVDAPLDFQGYVGAWNGSDLTSILYTSGTRTVDNGNLGEFSFNTGNLAVTAGATYVAFLSVSGLPVQYDLLHPVGFYMPLANTDIAGDFVFQNNGQDLGALFTDTWYTASGLGEGIDAFFKADFGGAGIDVGPERGGVPEPATWAMMLTGFGMAGAVLRRRRLAIAA